MKTLADLRNRVLALLRVPPHRNGPSNLGAPSDQRYVLLKGFSGLGNRILALLQAVAYARLANRLLVVDWNDFRYSPDGKDVFHKVFRCPIALPIDILPSTTSVVPTTWRRRLGEPMERMIRRHRLIGGADVTSTVSIDARILDYPETIAVFFDYEFGFDALAGNAHRFPDEWRARDATDLARKLLHDHLEIDPRIRQKVAEFKRQHFGSTTVGVHVRQTDNMSRQMVAKGKAVSVPALERAVEECLRTHPDATLLVASDNERVLAAFQARHHRLATYPKWFPAVPGQALHGHPACPDKVQMLEEALVELYLLSECDILIYSSRSSFARLARLLAPSPQQQGIDADLPTGATV